MPYEKIDFLKPDNLKDSRHLVTVVEIEYIAIVKSSSGRKYKLGLRGKNLENFINLTKSPAPENWIGQELKIFSAEFEDRDTKERKKFIKIDPDYPESHKDSRERDTEEKSSRKGETWGEDDDIPF